LNIIVKKKEYLIVDIFSSMRTAIVARSRERDRYLRTINSINFHCAALRGLPCGCSISSGLFVGTGDAQFVLVGGASFS